VGEKGKVGEEGGEDDDDDDDFIPVSSIAAAANVDDPPPVGRKAKGRMDDTEETGYHHHPPPPPPPADVVAKGSSGRESAIGTVHVRAFHILVKHKDAKNPVSRQDPTGAAIQSRTIEEAHEILQTLKAAMLQTTNSGTSSSGGKVDLATFKQIAMEVSDCDTSSRQGGDMGHIYRGQIMKEFEDAAFGLEVGAISGPIESPVGVHIIYRAE